MISKKKLYSGDIVRLRNGCMGYITIPKEDVVVCIRGYAISDYDNNMCERNCYIDADVVAVFYTSRHSLAEIAEKYIALANEHDNGVWDEEVL